MKTNLASSLRLAALAATLCFIAPLASAKDNAPADRASQLLAARGLIAVQAVGPYVEAGTFRIQVAVKLGRPNATLADGTWLYHDFQPAGSEARGTLVVRFNDKGCVRDLSLVTPAIATAMITPKKAPGSVIVATRN